MHQIHSPTSSGSAALTEIERSIQGEVRSDRLSRALYSTDASIYEIVPDGVVLPRTVEDIQTVVRVCGRHGVAVTPRGGGTGLTGGAVNHGVQIDCSRYLDVVHSIDPETRTAVVGPGVVLDEINAKVAAHGLQFAPDVATSSRATLGGMIANNSCGAHSIIYGRTVNHVQSVDVVLSDGSLCTFGDESRTADNDLAARGEQTLSDVLGELGPEIDARYPKILRNSGGYALNLLRRNGAPLNTQVIICGSEGTLGVITRATIKLIELPKAKGLLVVHFADLFEALSSVPAMLEHKPAAVELVDRLILNAAKANPAMARRRDFIKLDPAALLLVEFYDESMEAVTRRMDALAADLRERRFGYASVALTESRHQADAWEVRKSGLGLLMSRPGRRQPYAFVEDTAVDPVRLCDYMKRFFATVAEEGIHEIGAYAHASVGCLHMRPILNLHERDDVERMRRIGDRLSSLVVEFGGTMSAEHGDGMLHSEWLPKMYGPRIMDAFARIKAAFDPAGVLNPNKIVKPPPMNTHLRLGPDFKVENPLTILDFSEHGGMGELVGMCTGVGQCRQRLVGTMCPSYMATNDEKHTTRARANALRLALSNRDMITGLDDPALDEVMDLCLMCKACKTECPTGTDMTRLKAEWLAHRHRTKGASRRTRFIARSVDLAPWGSRFAPISNWIAQSGWMRALLERRYGIDRRVPPPVFCRTPFRKWFKHYRKSRPAEQHLARPHVAFFVDTWTNYYTPQVGIAAVRLLEAIGYHVLVPQTSCCGRPLISKGLLPEAKLLAEENVEILAHLADRGTPIVGVEPSCILTLVDEFPQFVRSADAKRIAGCAHTIETFLARVLRDRPEAFDLFRGHVDQSIIYHGHCHQKAMVGTADARELLAMLTGSAAREINSGCCGMAGSFGHEVEHYDVAKAVGEQRLFPAIRSRGDAQVAVSGFSCRHQIEHHTGVQVRHLVEYLADSLEPRRQST